MVAQRQTPADKPRHYLFLLCWILAIIWISGLYWPGLAGPFLLDDYWNLAPLAENGGLSNLSSWLAFVLTGESGPLGRPFTLASFTLNAQNWPASPLPFKATNLAIHLLVAIIGFVFARQLGKLADSPRPNLFAAITALLWVSHPQHVSTVLYVVQRMTELSALFVLVGLTMYLHGRTQINAAPPRGYHWMFGGLTGAGLAAVLSKENGALLPLYALLLEATILTSKSAPSHPHLQKFKLWMLWLPLLLVAQYFLWRWPHWIGGYAHRDFTLAQRMLAEGPILLDYLRHFPIPSLTGASVFRETHAHSYPTAFALAAWATILTTIVIAWRIRAKAPLIAFGILWFFAAHCMESTFLPLELYFDHRNYLPYWGLAIAVSAALATLPTKAYVTLSAAIIAMWSLLTVLQTSVWGDERKAAQIWYSEQPGSWRAAQFLVTALTRNQDTSGAISQIQNHLEKSPDNLSARLQLLELQCAMQNKDIQQSIAEVARASEDFSYRHMIPDALSRLSKIALEKRCPGLTPPAILEIIDIVLANPKIAHLHKAKAKLLLTRGQLLAGSGALEQATLAADQAGRTSPAVNSAYWKSIWMLEAGYCELAKIYAGLARKKATKLFFVDNPPAFYLDTLDAVVADTSDRHDCLDAN